MLTYIKNLDLKKLYKIKNYKRVMHRITIK